MFPTIIPDVGAESRFYMVKGGYAIIDKEDAVRLNPHAWRVHENGHGYRVSATIRAGNRSRWVSMARFLLDAPRGMVVDHINGNGLDNRRANLRIATNAENVRNMQPRQGRSSQYKGVNWNKGHRKWQAQIMRDRKNYHLGWFDDERAAALAYDEAAKVMHGEFARTNFGRNLTPEAHTSARKSASALESSECLQACRIVHSRTSPPAFSRLFSDSTTVRNPPKPGAARQSHTPSHTPERQ